jgi:hypothetical protein
MLPAVIRRQASPARAIGIHNTDLVARLHFEKLAGKNNMTCQTICRSGRLDWCEAAVICCAGCNGWEIPEGGGCCQRGRCSGKRPGGSGCLQRGEQAGGRSGRARPQEITGYYCK